MLADLAILRDELRLDWSDGEIGFILGVAGAIPATSSAPIAR
jgi:hypothetical protein